MNDWGYFYWLDETTFEQFDCEGEREELAFVYTLNDF